MAYVVATLPDPTPQLVRTFNTLTTSSTGARPASGQLFPRGKN